MRNFQDTFKTRKRSFISVFSICMTVPLRIPNVFVPNAYFLYPLKTLENRTVF